MAPCRSCYSARPICCAHAHRLLDQYISHVWYGSRTIGLLIDANFTSDVFVYSSLSNKKILLEQNENRTKPFACSCRSENRVFVLWGLLPFSLEKLFFLNEVFLHSFDGGNTKISGRGDASFADPSLANVAITTYNMSLRSHCNHKK
jgi:hypothetical protein